MARVVRRELLQVPWRLGLRAFELGRSATKARARSQEHFRLANDDAAEPTSPYSQASTYLLIDVMGVR